MNYDTEERNKNENPDEDEDLRRASCEGASGQSERMGFRYTRLKI